MKSLTKAGFHFSSALLLFFTLNHVAVSFGRSVTSQSFTRAGNNEGATNRMRRSAYIFRVKSTPEILQKESNELVPVRDMPTDMSFRGAGYLRPKENPTSQTSIRNLNMNLEHTYNLNSAIAHHQDTTATMEDAQSVQDYTSSFPLMHARMAITNSSMFEYPFASPLHNNVQSSLPASRLNNHRMAPKQTSGSITHNFNDIATIPHTRSKRSYRSDDPYERDDHYVADAQERHYGRQHDQEDPAGSGFIPLSGHFNGGAIHLTLPFFGSGQKSFSSGTPIGSSYGGPDSRPYMAREENYFYPPEHRRYSYGILGSGNFEVIKGGTFPGQGHSGRSPYDSGDIYNYNYGTREIILDGPIQGFQGFDNFPIHLINALSKQSEYAVRKPDHH